MRQLWSNRYEKSAILFRLVRIRGSMQRHHSEKKREIKKLHSQNQPDLGCHFFEENVNKQCLNWSAFQ